MATQVIQWRSKGGKLYDTEAEADAADFASDVSEVLLRGGGYGSDDFDVDGAVAELLKEYKLEPLA